MTGELVIISFPKSGRTWLRVMLDDLGIDHGLTHDGAAHAHRRHAEELDPDKSEYRDRRVLLLIRDPRDAVASGYFQTAFRLRQDVASMADFVRDPRHGIEKAVMFQLQWFAAMGALPAAALLRYEALRHSTARMLGAAARFAGAKVGLAEIEAVAANRTFERMLRGQEEGEFVAAYGTALTPAIPGDPRSHMVRRGLVGGFRDELSADDIRHCNEVMRRTGYAEQLARAISRHSVLGPSGAPPLHGG